MVLSDAQLWALFLIVPALVSGVVSSTVALLLQRLRRERVFGSFAVFSLALTTYGFVDGILAWSKPDLDSAVFVALGVADLFLIGFLTMALGWLTADLLGLSPRPWVRWLFRLPPLVASLAGIVVVSTLPRWTLESLLLLGACFLLVLFGVVVGAGVRLVVRWRSLHDRLFRRLLAATGILLMAFVPLWLLDLFARVGLFSFYWFLLIWNLAALTLASRAFFEPRPEVGDRLFDPRSLDQCAQRFGLTAREAEVSGLHAQGYSAKEIGERLFISPKTVRNHISSVYEKTGTGQRREWLERLRNTVPGH